MFHLKFDFVLSNSKISTCRFIAGKVFDFQLDKTWKDFLEYEYNYVCIVNVLFHFSLSFTPLVWMSLQFTEHGIEGVVPLELLTPEERSKYQAKPNDRSKRAKKEESKGAAHRLEENQVYNWQCVEFVAFYC